MLSQTAASDRGQLRVNRRSLILLGVISFGVVSVWALAGAQLALNQDPYPGATIGGIEPLTVKYCAITLWLPVIETFHLPLHIILVRHTFRNWRLHPVAIVLAGLFAAAWIAFGVSNLCYYMSLDLYSVEMAAYIPKSVVSFIISVLYVVYGRWGIQIAKQPADEKFYNARETTSSETLSSDEAPNKIKAKPGKVGV